MRWNLVFTILMYSAFLNSPMAFATTVLKQVQLQNGSELKLSFDKRIKKDDVVIDYLNDIIQLSIQNASIYPAKIVPLNGKILKKVFAYQFSPKVVRCRLSVGEKMDKVRELVHFNFTEKNVIVSFDNVAVSKTKAKGKDEKVLAKSTTKESGEDVEEAELLNKVLQTGKPSVEEKQEVEKPVQVSHKEQKHLKKASANFWSTLLKTGGVLVAFGLIVVAYRRKRFQNPFAKLINASLGAGIRKDKKFIQVVAKHYLEPKKSLIVVRVGGRQLLLGSSYESIRLITELPEDSKVDLEEKADVEPKEADQLFSQILEAREEVIEPSASSIRSKIRSRLEGLKPL